MTLLTRRQLRKLDMSKRGVASASPEHMCHRTSHTRCGCRLCTKVPGCNISCIQEGCRALPVHQRNACCRSGICRGWWGVAGACAPASVLGHGMVDWCACAELTRSAAGLLQSVFSRQQQDREFSITTQCARIQIALTCSHDIKMYGFRKKCLTWARLCGTPSILWCSCRS